VIRARKRFGQHFLHDQAVLRRIVDSVNPQPGEHLVEVGPGAGALTTHLLDRVEHLDAIEIDRDLAAALRARWPARLRLHAGDALEFDFTQLSVQLGGPLRLVGNLPYNISTPLLFHFLQHRQCISDMHIMLQKEVIERMAAAPGTSDYGRLTVMLAPWLRVHAAAQGVVCRGPPDGAVHAAFCGDGPVCSRCCPGVLAATQDPAQQPAWAHCGRPLADSRRRPFRPARNAHARTVRRTGKACGARPAVICLAT
jgi:16S rRNA (adenine1518-N6/adenine1519-N6)-dimethyltransferase